MSAKKLEWIRIQQRPKAIQVAPAVRTVCPPKKLVTALKKLGFDHVYDTIYAADLTIFEEGTEFIERIQNNGPLPLMTSCCPGWMQLVHSDNYTGLQKYVSTCKSPQLMMGAMLKHMHPDTIVASVMPCVRKQAEADTTHDVDVVFTVNELMDILQQEHISLDDLEETPFDSPFADGSGGGVIFGRTGGVMEAALRFVYYTLKKDRLPPLEFTKVDGFSDVKEATIDSLGVRVAVVVGLGDAKKVAKMVLSNECPWQFVEVMACAPLGCVSGAGLPNVGKEKQLLHERKDALNALDPKTGAHENESLREFYEVYLKNIHEHFHNHDHHEPNV